MMGASAYAASVSHLPFVPDAFDPLLWLRALTAIGGGYALMADRRLALLVDGCDDDELAGIMSQVIGQPERQEAIKWAIEQRQIGEAA
jgi:hypothetical protein